MLQVIRDTIQCACDEQINERQQGLVSLLKDSPALTIADLAKQVGCSVATVRRDLAHLQKLGIIRREGSRKAGLWVVV